MATVKAEVKQVDVAKVVRHGQAIQIPDNMTVPRAIATLERLMQMEEETYTFTHTFDAFIWDGAAALGRAIEKVFGFGFGQATISMFGSKPPQLIEVRTGPNPLDRILVPWGEMTVPGIEGRLWTSGGVEGGKFVFKVIVEAKRKHEGQLKALVAAIETELRERSIYRGKAIKVAFQSDRTDPWTGEKIPNTPEFLPLGKLDESQLILNAKLAAQVETSLFTPIDRIEDLRAMGESGKRGFLLAGKPGTGKTLTAMLAANKAVAQGTTFILCESAAEFAQAVQFAQQMSPAVVFCEDIDRVLQGQRTANIDAILNTMDGVLSKSSEVIVVLTTNNDEVIPEEAMRPGRFDDVIWFELPDAHATEQLIRLYAKTSLAPGADISEAGRALQGNIPAVIAEAVKRAKLAQVKRSPRGTRVMPQITAAAMVEAAESMQRQIERLQRGKEPKPTELETASRIIGHALVAGLQHVGSQTSGSAKISDNTLKHLTAVPEPVNGKAERVS